MKEFQNTYKRLFGLNLWHLGSVSSFRATILFLTLINSCTTTKYTYEYGHPRKVHLVKNDVILIPWLPSEDTDFYLERITKLFQKKGIYAKYLIAEEWEINTSAIEYPIDTSDFQILYNLGYTHILYIQNMRTRAAPVLSYYTPLEASQEHYRETFKPTLEHVANEASIHIRLTNLDRPYQDYDVTLLTSIGNMRFVQKDQGEYQVNLSDEDMASNYSILKGVKRLIKDCYTD